MTPRAQNWRPAPRHAERNPLLRILLILTLSLLGAAAVIGPWWWIRIRPRMRAAENPFWGHEASKELALSVDKTKGDFDRRVRLPGNPIGIASHASDFVIANREEPWGFLRVTRQLDGALVAQKIPVIETTYRQRMSFDAVTWNGKSFIGYTTGSWFGSKHEAVFTIHDPGSLRVASWKPAPANLGCLAWDGQHYWAATRKNTVDSNEEAFLYKIDRAFRVVAKYPPPSVGCQGLAWENGRLWLADVFSDSIHIVDTTTNPPSTLHSQPTPFNYLSGAVFDGEHIWIAEYDDNELHRLRRKHYLVWTKQSAEEQPRMQLAEGESLDELQRKLRSDDWADRMDARMRLEQLGEPIRYARDQESSPSRPLDDTEVVDWAIEIRDDELYGSWHLFFGEEVFYEGDPSSSSIISIPKFARYTITVRSDALDEPIVHEFEAEPEDNVRSQVLLASDLREGEYEVELFVHVQYEAPDGQQRILNRSGMSLEVER